MNYRLTEADYAAIQARRAQHVPANRVARVLKQQTDAAVAAGNCDARHEAILALPGVNMDGGSAAKRGLYALGRLKAGAMNKTEMAYEAHLKMRPDIVWYRFEGVKLRLADATFYTPDFAVLLQNGNFECHEVKGYWLDDARVKIKVAAEMYPFRFLAVTAKPKKDGGGWAVEEF